MTSAVNRTGHMSPTSALNQNLVTATGSTTARSLAARFADVVNVKDFGAVGDGVTDDGPAIQAAVTAAGADRSAVHVPFGSYVLSSALVLPDGVRLIGQGYSHNSGTSGATTLLKSGTFVAVTLGHDGGIENLTVRGMPGNGGDGIYVPKGRSYVRDVASIDHGGNGFRIGSDSATDNANIWRLYNCYAVGNAGHGVYIHHNSTIPSLPDANAGIVVGLDTRSNGGDGLRINQAIDNDFYGLTAQTNGGYGIRVQGAGNVFWRPYVEGNTAGEALLDIGSAKNLWLFWRSGGSQDGVSDLGTGNNVIGRTGQIAGSPMVFRTTTAFKSIAVDDEGISGYWSITQDVANRDLQFELLGTSAVASANFKSVLRASAAFVRTRTAPTYGASIAIDAALGNVFAITATDGVAFTVANPTNPRTGQTITVQIRNTSGGALGAVTWGSAYRMAAWTSPATANSRAVSFIYDGTNWIEVSRTPADVPN